MLSTMWPSEGHLGHWSLRCQVQWWAATFVDCVCSPPSHKCCWCKSALRLAHAQLAQLMVHTITMPAGTTAGCCWHPLRQPGWQHCTTRQPRGALANEQTRLNLWCNLRLCCTSQLGARSCFLVQGGWRGNASERHSAVARKLQRDQAAAELAAAEAFQVCLRAVPHVLSTL